LLLLKLCYCHEGFSKINKLKNPIKKTNQKNSIKTVGFETTCPKWHCGQVGQGAKKPYGGVCFTKILGKKNCNFL